jgi:serine/threonine-protein kinase
MGEVYKAHDTKLRRDVAIKVLPVAFARDAGRLSRFRREAQLLASLNHTNIATIHAIENSNDTNYLVMELVPGDTLAQRIKREGAVPVEESLTIAKQIAEALEYAHDHGVIHRDLKPANVKLTPEGKVKVLDFGLAKAFVGDASNEDIGDSPTLTMAATMQGVILGTAAYMSPEQARGKTVDRRTDIWAFGAVLYELLKGKQVFHGEDVTEILAAVVMKEPAFDALPWNTPASIRVLLQRCLRKDKRHRLADATGLRIEIEDVIATATSPFEQPLRLLMRLDVDLGADVSLRSVAGADGIISPDGTRIVYVSQGRLFTRRLDQPNAIELAGTQDAHAPFFSPDGQWIGYFAHAKLKKISLEVGAAITLRDAPNGRGGTWCEDGNIITALDITGGLSRIPSAGGLPTPGPDLQDGEVTHRWPQILPGGKAVLFTSHTSLVGFDRATIEVMSLADHRRKTLVRGGTYGRYLPSGHLVYVNRGTLFAAPFDVDRLEVRGAPAPVLDQIGYSAGTGSAQLDFSQTGILIYRSGEAGGGLPIVAWLDGTGAAQPLLAKPGLYSNPSLSPDGQRLAVDVVEGSGADIWVYDWQRDTMTRLTFNGSSDSALWSPNGRYIIFRAVGEGLSVTRSDGAGKPQPLTQSKNNQSAWSLTPDGKRLAFMEQSSGTAYDLWTVPLESDNAGLRAGKPKVFMQTPANEAFPSFSPDGQWMAYTSDESGTNQVYVRAFPDKGGKWQISNSGGIWPMWSCNGRELYFETLDNRIMATAYAVKRDSFVADKPRLWSEKQLGTARLGQRNVHLAPDGKRLIALIAVEEAEEQKPQNHVTFLMNFSDELRRKVPVGK